MTPPGINEFINPEMYPVLAALIKILVNTSTTRLKNKGDKGSPCLRPLPGLKYGLFTSLSLMQIDPPITRLIT
jgi:hypothetical protein